MTDDRVSLTYEQMDATAERVASYLSERGLAPGDRVVLFMANRAEYLTLLFGIFKGGFVAVPVNAKLHVSEVAFIVEHCAAGAVLVDAKSSSLVRGHVGGAAVVHVDDEELDWLRQGAQRTGSFVDHAVRPDDPAWIFYTSGTTGRPKGATLTHRNLRVSAMNALADMCDFQPEDVVLHVAPLSHGSGLYALPAVARASSNVIHGGGSFRADEVLDGMRRQGVTVVAFMAPTMIHMLLESDLPAPPLLRRIMYGGAPIDAGLVARAIDRFGPVFVQLYGMGESPMTITYLRPADHHGQTVTSAGIPRTDVEVQVLDDVGNSVPDGVEGEICVRGDIVMAGYWNDPDATARALRDGWLHTGDVGRFESGFLFLLSRRNDVIISGGSNIYPREVEEALMQHPAVTDACVFGVPDDKWGESVVAAVVVDQPTTVDSLLDTCREHIASFKKPSAVVFVDALPVSAYGKVLRREVRDGYLRGLAESVSATAGERP